MYSNIGSKIKTVASAFAIIGIIGSVILGMVLLSTGASGREPNIPMIIIGFVVMIIGSLLSWLGSLGLYGFGELVEKTSEIASTLTAGNANDYQLAMAKIIRLKEYHAAGLITDEVFINELKKN